MFVLDTNVLSEIMRVDPARSVAAWILRQPSDRLFTAAVCQAEILSGLAVMSSSRRRAALAEVARAMFADDFQGRVLPFDAAAAAAYADAFAARRKAGRPIATADLMIAATATATGACIVTRNAADFEGLGLMIINPWDEAPEEHGPPGAAPGRDPQ